MNSDIKKTNIAKTLVVLFIKIPHSHFKISHINMCAIIIVPKYAIGETISKKNP